LPIAAGGVSGATASVPAAGVRSLFVAIGFLVTARRFFFAAFLPADFNFRVRIDFFFAALRFVGMGIFLSTSNMWHRPYNLYVRGYQVMASDCTGGNNSFDAVETQHYFNLICCRLSCLSKLPT
jgi:hypothetical protein